MLLNKNEENRKTLEIVNLDDLVPKEHLLRKIDAAVNFERIYELVENLYCPDNGRPSIDPVVLFKIVLIQHIYGIRLAAADSSGNGNEYRIPLVYRLSHK